MSLGSAIGTNLNRVREHVRNMERDFRKSDVISNAELKIEDACNQYLVPYYERFTRDSKRPIGIIENHIKKYLGHLDISRLRSNDVQTLVYKLMDDKYSPESIRKVILVGSKLYSLLNKNSLSVHNPFSNIDRPKVINIRENILTAEQRLPFINICAEIDDVFSDFILVLLFTGLRVSEAMRLKSQDISDDFSTLTLVVTKAGVAQRIALNSLTQKLLRRRLTLTWNEYIFPSPVHRQKHISPPRGCLLKIKKIMLSKGHDIDSLVLHDLRRSFATVCAEVTQGDLQMVAQQLRHSSTHVLKRYLHYQQDGLTTASEATAQAIMKQT